jgi:drug/metabolite transporter (DMT)-like permease
MRKNISVIYVLLAVLLWASTASVGKLLLENLTNLQVLFYASLFAAGGMLVIVCFQKKIHIVRTYRLIDYGRFALMGFVGVFLYNILLFAGLSNTSAQTAFIVNYTWPVWVVIFAGFILKEEFTFKKSAAVILGFVGIYIAASGGNLLSFKIENINGVFYALAGAISYGIFSVTGKKHNDDKLISAMFYNAFTFVYISIILLMYNEIPGISFLEFLGLFWLGFFTFGLAYVFWLKALELGDTAKMSGIIFLTPFLSLVYIYFLLQEPISIYSLMGLVLIITGIIVLQAKKKFRKNE